MNRRALLFLSLLVLVGAGLLFYFSVISKGRTEPQPQQQEGLNPTQADPDFNPSRPEQLESRFQLNRVFQSKLIDLDNDGQKEAVAITGFDDGQTSVFIYYGFYHYDDGRRKWVERESGELNILNVWIPDTVEEEKREEFREKFITMMTMELTKIDNTEDITGDGYPDVLFWSLVQGKQFQISEIIAQEAPDNLHYVIRKNLLPYGGTRVEEGKLVEKYGIYENENDTYPVSIEEETFEWQNGSFELIKSESTPFEVNTTPSEFIENPDSAG